MNLDPKLQPTQLKSLEHHFEIEAIDPITDEMTQSMLRIRNSGLQRIDIKDLITFGCLSLESSGIKTILGASGPNDFHDSRPYASLYFATGVGSEVHCTAILNGPRKVHPKPFVAYIETERAYRKDGVASRLVSLMNEASKIIYGSPVESGPSYYLSEDGTALAHSFVTKFGCELDDNSVVKGR